MDVILKSFDFMAQFVIHLMARFYAMRDLIHEKNYKSYVTKMTRNTNQAYTCGILGEDGRSNETRRGTARHGTARCIERRLPPMY